MNIGIPSASVVDIDVQGDVAVIATTSPNCLYMADLPAGQLGECVELPSNWTPRSVSASGHRAIISGMIGLDGEYAIYDLDTRAPVTQFNSSVIGPPELRFGFSAALDGSTAYVSDLRHRVYAVDVATRNVKWQIDNPLTSEYEFGRTIAVADGIVSVGSPLDGTASADHPAGLVHLYDAESGNFLRSLTPEPSPELNPKERSYFGTYIAMDRGLVVVGEWPALSKSDGQGRVDVFRASDGKQLYELDAERLGVVSSGNGPFFGNVDASHGVLIVGAQHADNQSSNSGAALVFDLETGKLLSTLSQGLHDAEFGGQVAVGNFAVVSDAHEQLSVYSVPEPNAAQLLSSLGLLVAGSLRRCQSHEAW